ncbi:uncharacterized protein LOC106670106 isoform X6 [Cimex lectularius]|uniref:Uncharacterized protein n=1 Tax=Cimex lectularius TaxID=79782 RepID=A0A8I6S4J2_CIMLE|nr:uncharacterized protein LOC106670106 isoform X6 [Cimex lectularius]
MAKRDGDDNLSPEMQAKMQAAKKLQDELNAKLSQFGQIASNKNMSSVKEYDDLEKELLELKKYAASVKNENDAKLNDMINAMNKKMEKMAKTALEEQAEAVKKSKKPLQEMREIVKKIIAGIQELEISLELKTDLIENATLFLTMAEQRVQSVKECLTFLEEALKESSQTEQITKENLNFRIDDFLNTMESLYPSQGKKIKPAGKNIKKGQKH